MAVAAIPEVIAPLLEGAAGGGAAAGGAAEGGAGGGMGGRLGQFLGGSKNATKAHQPTTGQQGVPAPEPVSDALNAVHNTLKGIH